MKAKTIKLMLRKKMDEWLDSIEDKALRVEVKENCIVTGGAIASMLLNEEINDYDVYFTNKETTRKISEYYVKKFKENPPPEFKDGQKIDIKVIVKDDRVSISIPSQGVASSGGSNEYQYFEATDQLDPSSDLFIDNLTKVLKYNKKKEAGFCPIFLSSNAITLSNNIQLIIRFYGNPEEIHENYDFVHCTNYWVSASNELVLRPKALEALLTKELIYIGSKYPLCSLIRTRKFIKRGFTCNAGQFLKMCWQVSELDLNDINVLEDQLVGVDVAYFQVLIDALKLKQKELSDFKYNYSYVVELIDKIF